MSDPEVPVAEAEAVSEPVIELPPPQVEAIPGPSPTVQVPPASQPVPPPHVPDPPPPPPNPPHEDKSTPHEDKLTKKDVVLYTFGLVLAVLVFGFMYLSQKSEEVRMASFVTAAAAMSKEDDSASTRANQLRYSYAAAVYPSTTARANVSLMVGTFLALMGSFLIVRGVRDSPISGQASTTKKFEVKFAASSPGLVLAFLGCTIIGLTIWKSSGLDVKEPPFSEESATKESPLNDLEPAARAAIESLNR